MNFEDIRGLIHKDSPPPLQISKLEDYNFEETYAQVLESTKSVTNKFDVTGKVEEVNKTLQEVVNTLNVKYQLNIVIDFNDFGNTLKSIIDPTNKRVLELYTSEIFGRFRVIQYIKLIQAVALMMDSILDPKELMNPKLSYSDRFAIVKNLFEFMKELETIYSEIKINSSELELKNINTGTHNELDADPAVLAALQEFRKNVITNNQNK
jgi:hypothetical protein